MQNIKRRLVSYLHQLQRWVFILPAIILVLYVIGIHLSAHPSTDVHTVKKDLPETLNIDEIIHQDTHPKMTSESSDTYSTVMGEESPAGYNLDSSVTVLAISSHDYVDLTTNWLRSIETLHIYPNITVIATDDVAYDQLSLLPNLDLIRNTAASSPDVKRGPKSFTNTRWRVTLDMLVQNQDVLISDVDMVWLENPFPYLSDSRYDIFLSWDPLGKLCPGFIFLRSTPKTIEFVSKFISKLSNASSDTELLNSMISNRLVSGLQLNILDPFKFISGQYFNVDWRTAHSDIKRPVVVHSSGVTINTNDLSTKHEVKMDLFKNHGLWYLNGNARLRWDAGIASIADY